jgi:hypothetical protein
VAVTLVGSSGDTVRESRLCCQIVMIMLLESNGYSVRELWLWCQRVVVLMLKSKGYGLYCCGLLSAFNDAYLSHGDDIDQDSLLPTIGFHLL